MVICRELCLRVPLGELSFTLQSYVIAILISDVNYMEV